MHSYRDHIDRYLIPSIGRITLADLSGDGRPDLVLLTDCGTSAVGASYWELYVNGPTGFESPHDVFTLPSILGATTSSPASLSGSSACTASPARPTFTTNYVTSTELDLIVTTD